MSMLPWLLVLFVVILLLEIALFWAATALGSVEITTVKLLGGALLAALFWTGALGAFGFFAMQPDMDLLAPERRWLLVLIALGCLVVSWVVPAFLFVPVLPVSVPRGMLISGFQLVLRLFLYTLVGAVIMVVLAFLQIRYGPDKPSNAPPARTERATPAAQS